MASYDGGANDSTLINQPEVRSDDVADVLQR